ncbi:MAG: hypothetical protein LBI62_04490 [Candidatus Accumulibacter sp.]|jgi:hypothetical protein|nr:hypothetical protein [Accumulibacter sp.]
MTTQAISTSARQSFIEATYAVFGKHPEDVILFPIETGRDTLSWLMALFGAIESLHREHSDSMDIEHLARLGQYVAEDVSSQLDAECKNFVDRVQPA